MRMVDKKSMVGFYVTNCEIQPSHFQFATSRVIWACKVSQAIQRQNRNVNICKLETLIRRLDSP